MDTSVETEIGLLPETWPVRRLGDVFETQLGKMLSQKAHGGDAPKPYLRKLRMPSSRWSMLPLASDRFVCTTILRRTERNWSIWFRIASVPSFFVGSASPTY